jgi:D-glycero-alpha-D-manno-heptose-7-phosphate kinase
MKVIAQAPTRISLFGGGTDLENYYKKYGGMVISMAINLRQHIEIKTDNEEIFGTKKGLPEHFSFDFYRKFAEEFKLAGTLETSFDGIIESGLGSSASAAVALVGVIAKAKNIPMGRREIAEKAWDIEVNKLGLYGGKQDQYISAFGGLQAIYFGVNDSIYLNNLGYKQEEMIEDNLLLFYSGENRKNPKIQEELKELNAEKLSSLNEIKKIARYAKNSLDQFDIIGIGKLLNDSWIFKKKCNPLMTTNRIDFIYDTAMRAGAMGGKLMGSGGGGFMFFWVDPCNHELVIKTLTDIGCTWWDYSIDHEGLETRILP